MKFSLNRAGHDVAISGVKDHIDSKIANIVAFVLVDLGSRWFLHQTNYQHPSYYKLLLVADTT